MQRPLAYTSYLVPLRHLTKHTHTEVEDVDIKEKQHHLDEDNK